MSQSSKHVWKKPELYWQTRAYIDGSGKIHEGKKGLNTSYVYQLEMYNKQQAQKAGSSSSQAKTSGHVKPQSSASKSGSSSSKAKTGSHGKASSKK
ncbi:hypothetical protein G7Y89_g12894 [Cudoniella acicularis]|uniref:Uncharacterized protein n=1 Tax=Cudoniella acicularis TaxID=354080 RepID=A0A8H4R8C9_9HELO|nr:hypothetical protein G7Y89_g12894 [Cudoniella acicularis]